MGNELIILSVLATLLTLVNIVALARVLFLRSRLARALSAKRALNEEALAKLDRESTNVDENELDLIPNWDGADDHFTEAASVVRNLKEVVEQRIEAISDGRVRRKYKKMPRYDYTEQVSALEADNQLNREVAHALKRSFSIWRPYRSHRRSVPLEILQELSRHRAFVGQAANLS